MKNPLHATRNQLHNTGNPCQGEAKRVLCVCSAGLLRSATAAHTLSAEPFNWNTRSAGANDEYALNPVNEAMLHWADTVFVMETFHMHLMEGALGTEVFSRYADKCVVLNVPDDHNYRAPELVAEITIKVKEYFGM